MRKIIAIAVAAVLLTSCARAEQKPTPLGSASTNNSTFVGMPFPDIELMDYRNLTTSPASDVVHGKVINLWASWCAPCKREFPLMAKAQSVNNIVAININDLSESDSGKKQADELVALANSSLSVWIDSNNQLKTQLVLTGLPVTLAVNSRGIIVDSEIGELSAESLLRLAMAAAQ